MGNVRQGRFLYCLPLEGGVFKHEEGSICFSLFRTTDDSYKLRRVVRGNKIFNKLLAKFLATLVDHLLCHTAHFLSYGAGLFCKHEIGSFCLSLVHTTEASYKLRRVVGGNRPPTFFLSAEQSLLFLINRSELWQNLWAKRFSTNC